MSEPYKSDLLPMDIALAEAEAAAARGEVPVGAVIVDPVGAVIARAGNRTLELKDPTAHAEMLAIRAAAAHLGFARLRRLYFGASDEKSGGVEHGPRVFSHATCHHAPEVYGGLSERPAAALLKSFFAARRS